MSEATQPALRPHVLYMPGLDGLRAVAVLGVLLYHAELPVARGGFLGVEVFFVISGYLITMLLYAEWRATGRIDVRRFWLRRARRLLPALVLLIAATLAITALLQPDDLLTFRDDALAALTYVMNWQLILNHSSYFDRVGRTSLQHLWSLAIEEQFYLVWPLLFGALVCYMRRTALVIVVLAGAVASTLLMALLFVPDSDPSRIYYGTDTRAAGLLFGAAFALVWRLGHADNLQRVPHWLIEVVGVSALGALLGCFNQLDEFQPLLYRGGFTLIALLTIAVIAAVAHSQATLAKLLSWSPLRWIGTRSYGLYL